MSRQFFYHGSIRKSIIKFLSIFDDLKIAKYNSDGNITKYVDVPIKFMPKKKFYSWLYLRTHEKRYPMMGVELTSVEYDPNRASGQQEYIKVSTGDSSITRAPSPTPYNLGFTLSVATEFQNEMDQISEQLMPFFSPFVYTKVKIDELDISWDMQVIFQGANIDTETTIDEDNQRNILWTYNFIAKTYLVKPTASIDLIKKVVNKFYLSDESWAKRTDTEMPSGQGFEDEELLVIGWKEDDEILSRFMVFE